MRHIYIRTFAYNAEKTLCRAVDSILNQTYRHFTYYLLDNGSTDNTHQIIKRYAEIDERIVPFHTNKNMVFSEAQDEFLNLTKSISNEDLFCVLDADDEYITTFFQEAIDFLEKHDLDVVCCGSEFINSSNGRTIGTRALKKPMIIGGESFSELFPYYHVFMRTVWGKLTKGFCVEKYSTRRDSEDLSFPDYGIDTWDVITSFSQAKRIGIMSEIKHRYYISPKSGSYHLSAKRILSDQLLYEATYNYLKQYGEIKPYNNEFLLAVYMNALRDTMGVVLKADIDNEKKLSCLYDMFFCNPAKQLLSYESFGKYLKDAQNLQKQRKLLLNAAINWLFSLEEISDEFLIKYCDIGELLCAAAENADDWLSFKKLRVSLLIEEKSQKAYDQLSELIKLIPDDPQIIELQQLLSGL